jgi:hypothetical protein
MNKKNTCGTCPKYKKPDCPYGSAEYMDKSNPACSQHPKGKYVADAEEAELLPPSKNAISTSHTPDAVTAQYRRAVAGTLEMLRFGAMLVEIDQDLKRETSKGCIQTGESLKAWLESNCPDVNYKTAMRFKHLAEGLQREFNIPAKMRLTSALPDGDGSSLVPDEVPESKRKKVVDVQAEIWEFVQGKSARQLLFDFGMADRKATGGDRRSGIHMTESEKHEKHVDMVKKQYVIYTQKLVDMTRGLKEHLLLDAQTLAAILLQLDTVREELRAAQGKRK